MYQYLIFGNIACRYKNNSVIGEIYKDKTWNYSSLTMKLKMDEIPDFETNDEKEFKKYYEINCFNKNTI